MEAFVRVTSASVAAITSLRSQEERKRSSLNSANEPLVDRKLWLVFFLRALEGKWRGRETERRIAWINSLCRVYNWRAREETRIGGKTNYITMWWMRSINSTTHNSALCARTYASYWIVTVHNCFFFLPSFVPLWLLFRCFVSSKNTRHYITAHAIFSLPLNTVPCVPSQFSFPTTFHDWWLVAMWVVAVFRCYKAAKCFSFFFPSQEIIVCLCLCLSKE